MRILAIDPSITNLGVAILEDGYPIQVGTMKMKQVDTDRYLEIALKIKKVIQEYKPDVLALETQYIAGRFGNAVLKTCEVKGVCRGVFMLMNPKGSIYDIAPTEAKKEMGVKGKRKEVKIAVVKAIQDAYPELGLVDDNAADAVCIGLSARRKCK